MNEAKISNSYGSSPSKELLTISSDNKPLYSTNIIYKPYEENTLLEPLNERDILISYGGITVKNALKPKTGTSQINLNNESKGPLFDFMVINCQKYFNKNSYILELFKV